MKAARSTPVDTGNEASQAAGDVPHVLDDRIWLVLARRTYEEPLHEVGTVEADDPALAVVYAKSIYDEFAWIEMVVIPRESVVTVIEA